MSQEEAPTVEELHPDIRSGGKLIGVAHQHTDWVPTGVHHEGDQCCDESWEGGEVEEAGQAGAVVEVAGGGCVVDG